MTPTVFAQRSALRAHPFGSLPARAAGATATSTVMARSLALQRSPTGASASGPQLLGSRAKGAMRR